MGKGLSKDLRIRVIEAVEDGASRRAAAARADEINHLAPKLRRVGRAVAGHQEHLRLNSQGVRETGSTPTEFFNGPTVHKHRNLLAHSPKPLHDELTEAYRDMINADIAAEIETRRKAFLRKWRLKCRAVADSLEEAGDRLFSLTRLDPSQWKSARTTNAIERLNEEFRRRVKTQTVLPCAETVPILFWALLACGQIQMRKFDGWQTLSQPLEPMRLDLTA